MPSPKTERAKWIIRVLADVDNVVSGLNKAFQEINPEWKITKCQIIGSLGRYIAGEKQMFKTPYGGISGSEERGEVYQLDRHKSDVDMVCTVTPETDFWHGGSLVMHAEGEINSAPERYVARHRKGKCINFRGVEIASKHCNDVFRVPLDEHDLRKTHDIVLHLRK